MTLRTWLIPLALIATACSSEVGLGQSATEIASRESPTAEIASRFLVSVGIEPNRNSQVISERGISYAPLRADGTVDETVGWKKGPDLARGRLGYGVFTTPGAVHVVGGFRDDNRGSPMLETAMLGNSERFEPFVQTAMARAIAECSTVVVKDHVFALADELSTAQIASVEGGELGAWKVQDSIERGTAAETPFAVAAAIDNRVFVMAQGKRMLSAQLKADGSLGPYEQLPQPPLDYWVDAGAVVTHGHHVYVVGGYAGELGGPPVSDVYVAEVEANGALGGWVRTEPFPTPRFNYGVVVAGDLLYVVGGKDAADDSDISAIAFTHIRADGTLEPWKHAGQLAAGARGQTYAIVDRAAAK